MEPRKQHIHLLGVIHGHADELKALLQLLGYTPEGTSYKPKQGRTVLFLGDYIDRGPKITETLSIVRGMVEAGDAGMLPACRDQPFHDLRTLHTRELSD